MTEPAAGSPWLLHAEALCLARGGRMLLAGLDLRLAAGDKLAILGENGSGKSTLLRALAGLHPRRAGRLWLNGVTVPRGAERRLLAGGAWVPQHPPRGRFPFQVRELLATSGDLPAARAVACRLGLDGLETRGLATLSGGQLQRAFLARALGRIARDGAQGLLFADEPTAALDFAGQDLVAELLAGLPATVVLVTHDRTLAERLPRRLRLANRQGHWEAGAEPAP